MIDLRRELAFALEARAEGRVRRDFGGDQLERHPTSQPLVAGAVTDSHPASPERPLEPEARDLVQDLNHLRQAYARAPKGGDRDTQGRLTLCAGFLGRSLTRRDGVDIESTLPERKNHVQLTHHPDA